MIKPTNIIIGYEILWPPPNPHTPGPGFIFDWPIIYKDDKSAFTEDDKIILRLRGFNLLSPIYRIESSITKL